MPTRCQPFQIQALTLWKIKSETNFILELAGHAEVSLSKVWKKGF